MTKTIPGRLLSKDILSDIKETTLRAKKEYQRKQEENSRDKVYKRILNEAVILIRELWLHEAKDERKIMNLEDTFEVSANGAFLITEELKIYSEYGCMAFNPETNCCCFYDVFTFESEKEKEEYLKAVMERLPEGTICEVSDSYSSLGEPCHRYTYKLKVDVK